MALTLCLARARIDYDGYCGPAIALYLPAAQLTALMDTPALEALECYRGDDELAGHGRGACMVPFVFYRPAAVAALRTFIADIRADPAIAVTEDVEPDPDAPAPASAADAMAQQPTVESLLAWLAEATGDMDVQDTPAMREAEAERRRAAEASARQARRLGLSEEALDQDVPRLLADASDFAVVGASGTGLTWKAWRMAVLARQQQLSVTVVGLTDSDVRAAEHEQTRAVAAALAGLRAPVAWVRQRVVSLTALLGQPWGFAGRDAFTDDAQTRVVKTLLDDAALLGRWMSQVLVIDGGMSMSSNLYNCLQAVRAQVSLRISTDAELRARYPRRNQTGPYGPQLILLGHPLTRCWCNPPPRQRDRGAAGGPRDNAAVNGTPEWFAEWWAERSFTSTAESRYVYSSPEFAVNVNGLVYELRTSRRHADDRALHAVLTDLRLGRLDQPADNPLEAVGGPSATALEGRNTQLVGEPPEGLGAVQLVPSRSQAWAKHAELLDQLHQRRVTTHRVGVDFTEIVAYRSNNTKATVTLAAMQDNPILLQHVRTWFGRLSGVTSPALHNADARGLMSMLNRPRLAVGHAVLLLETVDVEAGLVAGTLCRVAAFEEGAQSASDSVQAMLLDLPDGRRARLTRSTLVHQHGRPARASKKGRRGAVGVVPEVCGFELHMAYFPVLQANFLPIEAVRGLTLPGVVIDCSSPLAFQATDFYAACAACQRLQTLYLHDFARLQHQDRVQRGQRQDANGTWATALTPAPGALRWLQQPRQEAPEIKRHVMSDAELDADWTYVAPRCTVMYRRLQVYYAERGLSKRERQRERLREARRHLADTQAALAGMTSEYMAVLRDQMRRNNLSVDLLTPEATPALSSGASTPSPTTLSVAARHDRLRRARAGRRRASTPNTPSMGTWQRASGTASPSPASPARSAALAAAAAAAAPPTPPCTSFTPPAAIPRRTSPAARRQRRRDDENADANAQGDPEVDARAHKRLKTQYI